MRILVTGNMGYIGSHLCKLLLDAGHDVVGCDINLYPKAISIDFIKPATQFNKDYKELTVEELFDFDAIAHLAALSNDALGAIDATLTKDVNYMNAVKLGRKAKLAGVKSFIFASTCSVYGETELDTVKETSLTNPLSIYSKSKLRAEKELSKLANKRFGVYLLRNASAYGASLVFRSDLLINSLSTSMYINKKAEIKSDGSPWRPFIHCFDMARAFKFFLEEPPLHLSGKPINIGFNSENFQVKTIGDFIRANYVGALDYSNIPTLNTGGSYKVDFTLLEKTFPNFSPVFPLSLGIPDLKIFLDRINYSSEEYNDGRYIRSVEILENITKLN